VHAPHRQRDRSLKSQHPQVEGNHCKMSPFNTDEAISTLPTATSFYTSSEPWLLHLDLCKESGQDTIRCIQYICHNLLLLGKGKDVQNLHNWTENGCIVIKMLHPEEVGDEIMNLFTYPSLTFELQQWHEEQELFSLKLQAHKSLPHAPVKQDCNFSVSNPIHVLKLHLTIEIWCISSNSSIAICLLQA
jgi:hypothetical protein